MDTTSVRLFVLAAEKRNISGAGRELGMAPAVASSRLAKLERELGADLLHRTTRRVRLSAEGEDFLPYAKEILAQEAEALGVLGRTNPEVTGTLRFTAPSTFAQLYIAPLLPEFLDRYPSLTLDLRFSDAVFDLIEGSFDLALRSSPREDSSHKGRKLAEDRRVLCASPDYLARHGTPTTPAELAAHHLIGFKDAGPKEIVNESGDTAVFEPRKAKRYLVLDDGLSHKLATMAGAGISLNSIWSIHEQLRDGSLHSVLPGYRLNDQSVLWLVYPKSNVLTAKVRVFIDFLIEKIGDKPSWL